MTLWEELEQGSASHPQLNLDTKSFAVAIGAKDSICRRIPVSDHTLQVIFHSFLFQTFALAPGCQSWS